MKKLIPILLLLVLAFACSKDSDVNESSNLERNLEYSQKSKATTCEITAPLCGYPNSSITCTFFPDPAGTNVTWTIVSGDITGFLGNGTSQVFNLGSSFSGGEISAIGGAFGCKETIYIPECVVLPTCSISGPNCGLPGELATFNFTGASSGQYVSWNSSSSDLTINNGQGTSSATFLIGSSFNGGVVTASVTGISPCSVDFTFTNCCESNRVTVNNKSKIIFE